MQDRAGPAILNHFGHCVTDLDRSVRFYCELLGFREKRRTTVPDSPTARLLRMDPPVGLTAVYLEKDGTVLELLSFDRPGNPPARIRPFNEPGLTHISFCVPDLGRARSEVERLGGEVLADTDLGVAILVRDPDGQPLELLAMELRAGL